MLSLERRIPHACARQKMFYPMLHMTDMKTELYAVGTDGSPGYDRKVRHGIMQPLTENNRTLPAAPRIPASGVGNAKIAQTLNRA